MLWQRRPRWTVASRATHGRGCVGAKVYPSVSGLELVGVVDLARTPGAEDEGNGEGSRWRWTTDDGDGNGNGDGRDGEEGQGCEQQQDGVVAAEDATERYPSPGTLAENSCPTVPVTCRRLNG